MLSKELRAGRESGRLLLVEGPAGIGKTALVGEAGRRAGKLGMAVLSARGGRLERDLSFGAARQLLRPLTESPGRKKLFAGAAAAAEDLLEGRELPEAAPLQLGNPLFHPLYWLCANASQEGPLALILDDAHWADTTSLGFLAFLARRIEELPLVLIIAARRELEETEPELHSELVSHARLRLTPEPLSETGVRAIVEKGLGDADDQFVAACRDASGGNPFYLGALIDELKGRSVHPTAASVGAVESAGPSTIAKSVLLRIGALPPSARAVATALAVLGDGSLVRQVAALAELPIDEAARAADALVGAQLLEARGDQLAFIHPIVRLAVYGDLSELRRGQLHGEAARLLAAEEEAPEKLAAHLLRAAARGETSVVETLRLAARQAMASGAPDLAYRYLDRALAEPPPAGSRNELLLELLPAAIRDGRIDALPRLEPVLSGITEPVFRGRVALELSPALAAIGRGTDAAALLEDAITGLEGADRELELRLEATLSSVARLDPRTSLSVPERLVRFRDLKGSTPGERLVLANVARQHLAPGVPVDKAAEAARRALAGGRLLEEDGPESFAFQYAVRTLITADCYAEAEGPLDAAVEAAQRSSSVFGFALTTSMRAYLRYRQGRLQEAETDDRDCLNVLIEAGAPLALPTATGHLILTLIETGEFEEADALLTQLEMQEEIPDLWLFQAILAARGRLRVAQGRLEEGIADLFEQGERDARLGYPDAGGYTCRVSLAPALAATGRHEEALMMIEEEIDLVRPFNTHYALGCVLRARGLIRQGDDALDDLREAVEVLDGSGSNLELARALVDHGAALRRANRRVEGREQLLRGLDLAHRCGAKALVERARDEVKATGARPRREMLSGVESLTASELRTARMAAEGLSNREIAQALFVTPKTVETHLASSYRKLDIASRKDLPAALQV